MQIGDILVGEFRILDVFGGEGKSGMGVVYLVEDLEYPVPFVLKTFQEADPVSTRRFQSEVETWIGLGIHPNIVEALFARHINDQLFVGAEFIAPDELGRNTLTDYLKQGAISNFSVIRWAAHFCYGMRHALSNGMHVHRDIKPDNLMIDNGGALKITDFGLAKAPDELKGLSNERTPESSPQLTNQGSFLGTVLYASPEQFEDSSSIDFRSDIYSFGLILYQLINAGLYPYKLSGRRSLEQLALMHFVENVIELEHPLFPIAKKCLAKDANERYQSYEALLDDLQSIADDLDIRLPIEDADSDAKTKALYRQALSMTELGQYEGALNLINDSLLSDAFSSSSWQLKGRILMESGKAQDGITATLKSLEFDPHNSKTLNNLGLFYGRVGEQEKGIAYLTKAIEVDNYNATAVMNLASALDKRGSYSGAARIVLTALNLTPDKKSLHHNAGLIAASAISHGHVQEGFQVLEKLVALDVANATHYFNLALCYQSANQKTKAIECYEKVLQLDPDEEQAKSFLAQIRGIAD